MKWQAGLLSLSERGLKGIFMSYWPGRCHGVSEEKTRLCVQASETAVMSVQDTSTESTAGVSISIFRTIPKYLNPNDYNEQTSNALNNIHSS